MTTRAQTPEGKLEAKIIRWLNAQPLTFAFALHLSPMAQVGKPDVICCMGGKFVGIEVKRDESIDATQIQRVRGRDIVRAVGNWHVCGSLDQVQAIWNVGGNCTALCRFCLTVAA